MSGLGGCSLPRFTMPTGPIFLIERPPRDTSVL